MDTLSECTCAFAGCSYEEVLKFAPCPPPSFYSEFAGYAIGEALCSTEICKIAKRCLTNFPTNDSSQIIQSICYPTPPTTSTTTPTTTPTLTLTTPPSSTSTPVAVTSTVTPGPITTPAPPTGLIALIVTLVLIAVLVAIVVILVVKYKRRGKFQISKWFSFITRRNTDRKGLIVRKETKTKVCFNNPNYSVCLETIESEEFQELSRISNKTTDVNGVNNENRISTVEFDLHIKGKGEEFFLDTTVTNEVDSVNLVEKKVVEKEKETELVDTLASSIVTGKETGIDGEEVADIDEILIGPASTTDVCEEHEKFKTNNNETINAQTKLSDRNELKKNITQNCDGAELTETIKANIEAEDSKTNGTAMSISDEPSDFEKDRTKTLISEETRDSQTSGRAFDMVVDCENTSDLTCKVHESEAEISATDGVQKELEANDSEKHSSPDTSD